jgi:hypothetical protein
VSGIRTVEDRLAGRDRRAVEDARDHRRHLADGRAGHHLVQQPDALVGLAPLDEDLPYAEPAQRGRVGIAEPIGNRGRLDE